MKTLLNGLSLLLALIAFSASAANSVTLAWNSNSETNLAGYRLYWGPGSRAYSTNQVVLSPPRYDGTNWINGTNTQTTVTNLPIGKTIYFAVTAFSSDGLESDYSDEVSFGFKPGKPTMLRIQQSTNTQTALWIQDVSTDTTVQYSSDLKDWRDWAQVKSLDLAAPLIGSVFLAGFEPSSSPAYWRARVNPVPGLLPAGLPAGRRLNPYHPPIPQAR